MRQTRNAFARRKIVMRLLMKKIISKRGALAFLLMGLIFIGCESHTYEISVDDKVPPTFKLIADDPLYFVRILKYPVDQKTDIGGNDAGIWQIERKGVWHRRPEVITYGIVPGGFIQKVPKDGSAPPALKEGEKYMFFAPTTGMFHGKVFKIENGKTVVVH
jgi:hypothetical protein